MATFTPPTAYDVPPILPDSGGLANRLFRYYPNRPRYITVFALSDGTFVQDTPSDENSNTNVPYPYNPYDPSAPYSTSYYYDYENMQPTKSEVAHEVWITKVYLGPTYVNNDEVAALTAAGYGGLIT